ncbi:hypothetical protein CsSME_00045128 [Camellia sinensis var. sinensis]
MESFLPINGTTQLRGYGRASPHLNFVSSIQISYFRRLRSIYPLSFVFSIIGVLPSSRWDN